MTAVLPRCRPSVFQTPMRLSRTLAVGGLLLALSSQQAMTAVDTAEWFDCVMDPAVVVKVGSLVPGLLEAVHINRGDKVKEGQVIAQLGSGVEQATVSLTSEQASSTAEIEAQQARLNLVEKKLDRTAELVRRNVASKGDLDAAVAEMEVVKRELSIAELRKRAAELELNRAKEVLQQKTIRSPIDGIVVEKTLSKGEYLDQDGKLATIAKLDPLHVEAFLPVSYFDKVEIGMTAQVQATEPVEQTFTGTISVIDQVFDVASSTFGLRVNLLNPHGAIPAGQRCRVTFDWQTN